MDKANILNELMGFNPKFVANTGWLDRFKKRHGIRQLMVTGELLSSDHEAAEKYIPQFAKTVAGYSPEEVYNCDESGLIFKGLPNTTLASEVENSAPGFKMSKERVTILACSNATGTHKLPLVVIGKSAKPRALKNINMKSLPVYYRSQKKAWMTGNLFKEWFHEQYVPVVKKFCKDNGLPVRALLVVDNAPSHPSNGELEEGEIKTIFLPKNVTPLLQPMDQNVLQDIKLGYRKRLLRTILENDDISVLQRLKLITLKDVVYWIAESWENVTERLIRKSWKKLWPSLTFVENSCETVVVKDELLELATQVPGFEEVDKSQIEQWIDRDHQQYTDEEIISIVQNKIEESDNDSNDEMDVNLEQRISHSEGLKALELALLYLEQQADASPVDTMLIRRWRDTASLRKFEVQRQTKMTDFCRAKDNTQK